MNYLEIGGYCFMLPMYIAYFLYLISEAIYAAYVFVEDKKYGHGWLIGRWFEIDCRWDKKAGPLKMGSFDTKMFLHFSGWLAPLLAWVAWPFLIFAGAIVSMLFSLRRVQRKKKNSENH